MFKFSFYFKNPKKVKNVKNQIKARISALIAEDFPF